MFKQTLIFVLLAASLLAAPVQIDTLSTDQGPLVIHFIGHGTLMMEWQQKVIHIDPVLYYGDYNQLPKADLVLITHEHGDHLSVPALEAICREETTTILTEACKEQWHESTVMRNGETLQVGKIKVDAVPAYNIRHHRSNGQPYHPKGRGNGYILTLGGLRIYVAGDTENTPEMKALQNIDVAFLPMNLPYTMSPEMVADAALVFKPSILYPYHFGETDTEALLDLLKDSGIDVRIREMK